MEGTMGVQQDTELFLGGGGWGVLGNLGGPRRDRVLPSVWDKRSLWSTHMRKQIWFRGCAVK